MFNSHTGFPVLNPDFKSPVRTGTYSTTMLLNSDKKEGGSLDDFPSHLHQDVLYLLCAHLQKSTKNQAWRDQSIRVNTSCAMP